MGSILPSLTEKIDWGMTLPEVQEIMSETEFKEFNVGPTIQ